MLSCMQTRTQVYGLCERAQLPEMIFLPDAEQIPQFIAVRTFNI